MQESNRLAVFELLKDLCMFFLVTGADQFIVQVGKMVNDVANCICYSMRSPSDAPTC